MGKMWQQLFGHIISLEYFVLQAKDVSSLVAAQGMQVFCSGQARSSGYLLTRISGEHELMARSRQQSQSRSSSFASSSISSVIGRLTNWLGGESTRLIQQLNGHKIRLTYLCWCQATQWLWHTWTNKEGWHLFNYVFWYNNFSVGQNSMCWEISVRYCHRRKYHDGPTQSSRIGNTDRVVSSSSGIQQDLPKLDWTHRRFFLWQAESQVAICMSPDLNPDDMEGIAFQHLLDHLDSYTFFTFILIWNGICCLGQRPSVGTSKVIQRRQKKERKKE